MHKPGGSALVFSHGPHHLLVAFACRECIIFSHQLCHLVGDPNIHALIIRGSRLIKQRRAMGEPEIAIYLLRGFRL